MAYVFFNSLVQANKFSADIDADLGYPRDGVTMGPGIHVPAGQARTASFAEVAKHPTRNEWAYPDEPLVQGKRGRREKTPSWAPPGQSAQAQKDEQ